MTKARKLRLINEVAPLVAQGASEPKIAAKLGISLAQAHYDCVAVKELWGERCIEEEVNAVRGEAIAKTEWIYAQAVEAWNDTRVSRFLDVALVALRDRVRLSGAELDLKLVQQNVNVTVASADQVANTFAPMSSADFQAFAQAHVDAQLRAAEAAKQLGETRESHAIEVDSQGEADDTSSWDDSQPDDEPKPKRIRHPRA